MIVFQYAALENFLEALKYRLNDEVFSQYFEPEIEMGAATNHHQLILQFLGNPNSENSSILALYQIKIEIKTSEERKSIIAHLQKAFKTAGDIQLIQGNITEIYRSLS